MENFALNTAAEINTGNSGMYSYSFPDGFSLRYYKDVVSFQSLYGHTLEQKTYNNGTVFEIGTDYEEITSSFGGSLIAEISLGAN